MLYALNAFGLQPETQNNGQPQPDTITPEIIESRRKEAAASDLDEATKQRIDELYTQAVQALKEESDAKATARIPQLPAPAEMLPQSQWPTEAAELEKLRAEANAELSQIRELRKTLEARQRDRSMRSAAIPVERAKVTEKVAETERALEALTTATDPPRLILARRTQLLARRQALLAELARLDHEASPATSALLSQQLDQAAQRIPILEERVAKLQQAVADAKQREAAEAARQARLKAAETHPAVKRVADEFEQLTAEVQQLAERLKDARAAHETLKADLEKWETQFARTKDRVSAAGLSSAIGLLLRRQKTELLRLARGPSAEPVSAAEMRDAQLRLYELMDRRADLASTEEEVQAVMKAVGPGVNGELEQVVIELLESEKEYLDTLIADYEAYFNTLGQMDDDQRRLEQLIKDYTDFIDERILWIDSMRLVGSGDIQRIWSTVQWLFNPANWISLGKSLWNDLRSQPWLVMVLLLGLIALISVQQIARRQVRRIGQFVAVNPVEPIRTTLLAIGLTLVIAACWPAFLGLVGWRLMTAGSSGMPASLGYGMAATSWLYLFWELIRQVCRRDGLARAHFRWNQETVQAIRGRVRVLMIPLLALALVINTTDHNSGFAGNDALGRLAFIAAMVVLAVFLHLMLRPKNVIVRRFIEDHPHSVIARTRYFWYGLVVGVPLALGVLAAVGYYFTALQLEKRFEATCWMLVIAVLIHQTLLRWLYRTHVRLQLRLEDEKLAAAREEFEAAQMAAAEATASLEARPGDLAGADQPTPIIPPPPPEIDLNAVSEQTRRLLRTMVLAATVIGLWFVWVDVAPALKMFDKVKLWSVAVPVLETTATAEGTTASEVKEEPRAVTLADLGLLVIVVMLAVVAAKNVPGLLEIAILRHLPFDHGARFAITTVVRYLIVLIGVVVSANTMEIGWSKVQWLVAAMAVGLGFGLQEIFANFVSGLIVLWERPIRVGDIVTVDGTTGVVAKIKMRATTITNWDRQEYVVPNKEFVTGRLLNWTLSDNVNRVVITVGLAYGSDTDRASELFHQIARAQPHVLSDPAPIVTFEEFGDSTLNFTVRVFLASMDNRLPTINSIHCEIHRRFADAGIEIAFPQRDLHIRSVDKPIPLLQSNAEPPAAGLET